MKIGFKLTAIMIALSAFSGVSAGVTMLVRAQTSITGLSEQYTVSMARDSAAKITLFLDAYFYKAETATILLEQYPTMIIANRRSMLNTILENLTRANPEISAVWCVLEPDVLEGGDLQYVGTKGAGASGRFAPYWYWDNGRIEVAAIENFEDPAYLVPRDTGLTTVTDPYDYDVGGETVLMTTIGVPIRADGKVVGVIGFDIPLTRIQEVSQTQKPFPDAVTAVFSSKGTVTAHFDESRLGKDMR
jgi:hypothetical protein